MDEIQRAKRLTQEILARAASIKTHMSQVRISWDLLLRETRCTDVVGAVNYTHPWVVMTIWPPCMAACKASHEPCCLRDLYTPTTTNTGRNYQQQHLPLGETAMQVSQSMANMQKVEEAKAAQARQQKEVPLGLLDLPRDLLFLVAASVKDPKGLACLACTCTALADVVYNEEQIWEELCRWVGDTLPGRWCMRICCWGLVCAALQEGAYIRQACKPPGSAPP